MIPYLTFFKDKINVFKVSLLFANLDIICKLQISKSFADFEIVHAAAKLKC